MFLLLDECCGKALVRIAEAAGRTAQRTVQVAALATAEPLFAATPNLFVEIDATGRITLFQLP